jgi:hypothetical protein
LIFATRLLARVRSSSKYHISLGQNDLPFSPPKTNN